MGNTNDEPSPASQVESVDFSEQSIDDQLVQLAQAKLDGQIDEETYERLVGLLKELPPRDNWDSSKAIEYATPRPGPAQSNWILWALLIVIILLMLIGLLLPVVSPIRTFGARGPQARTMAATTDIVNLQTGLDAFEIDNGRYPKPSEGLTALVVAPPGLAAWRGPYIRLVPNDPWGRPYTYVVPGRKNPNSFDLSSAGPDGKIGTADDISN